MLTNKELSYVSSWSRKVPYPGIVYAKKTAEKLIDAFEDYNKFYNCKEYEIILSNGEQISFEILNMNLCHMLGIDYKNLTSEYFRTFRENVLNTDIIPRSYDLLKMIISNIDKVLEYDCDNGNVLNYYRIMVKCSIFEKFSDFSKFNFGVINFDRDTYCRNGNITINSNSKKYLYVQSNEKIAPIFMMGILPDSNSDNSLETKYAVETLTAPTNIKDFFSAQEVVIPTQILISSQDVMDKLEATPSEKIALLNQYKYIIREYNLPYNLNINGDYEAILADQQVKKKVLV